MKKGTPRRFEGSYEKRRSKESESKSNFTNWNFTDWGHSLLLLLCEIANELPALLLQGLGDGFVVLIRAVIMSRTAH